MGHKQIICGKRNHHCRVRAPPRKIRAAPKYQFRTWYPCSPGALYGTRGTFPPPMRRALKASRPLGSLATAAVTGALIKPTKAVR